MSGKTGTSASWEYEIYKMFMETDKDGSGFISRDDIMVMLLAANEKEQNNPMFKMNLKFLVNVIKKADKDKNAKIDFEEFKHYIGQATAEAGKQKAATV